MTIPALTFLTNETSDAFIIHSVWISKHSVSAKLPQKYEQCVASWKKYHPSPQIVHVLWCGAAVHAFLVRYHPERIAFYKALFTEAQSCDYLRVLLMHTYGGMYVDIDFECHMNFIDKYVLNCAERKNSNVILLRSPLFCECYTNCLLIGIGTRHKFWEDVQHTIEETVACVQSGSGLSKTCFFLFNIPHAGHLFQILYTNHITGPSCIDRTILKHPEHQIYALSQDFYRGQYATHHEGAEWFPQRMKTQCKLLGVSFIFAIFMFTTWVAIC